MRQVFLLFLAVSLYSLIGASAQIAEPSFTLIDAGVLVAESNGVAEIIDTFSITQREDGTYKHISIYIDEKNEVNSQDLTLNPEFQPLRYVRSLTSPASDEITVKVELVDNRAIVSLTSPDGFQQQTFTTETEFLIFDGSAVDHLAPFLYRLWASGEEQLAFDALLPGNLQVIPSTLSLFGELSVRSGSETFTIEEYAWDAVRGGRLIRILALDGRFLGGLQLGDDGLEDVVYRADLYPAGLEIMR